MGIAPDTEIHDNLGRPHTLALGRVIQPLLG
jgi:hypothetical protein